MGNKKLDDALGAPFVKVKDRDLKGLKWPELKYLKDRGKLTASQERAAGFRPNRLGGTYPPGEVHSDDYGDEAYEDLEGPAQEEELQAEESEELDDEEYQEDDGGEVESQYATWTRDELKTEIRSRNELREAGDQLKLTGKHDELVTVLVEDDEADT